MIMIWLICSLISDQMKKLGHKSHFQESINVGVSWTVPMCVTRTLSPLGKCTKDDNELVMLVKRDIE